MKLFELPYESKSATGFTHKAIVTHTDLDTQTTDNTAFSVKLLEVEPGDIVTRAAFKLVTAFENTASTAFNTTTLAVGDDDVDAFINETEVNDNNVSPVFYASHINADTPKVYTLASTGPITATFMSMASESLAELNAGEVHVYLGITKLSDI
jgi:hypothetical protein